VGQDYGWPSFYLIQPRNTHLVPVEQLVQILPLEPTALAGVGRLADTTRIAAARAHRAWVSQKLPYRKLSFREILLAATEFPRTVLSGNS
jgi:hypothetical protein